MRQGIIWKKEKKEKERDWQRLRQRDRKKTNNPENEAAHYVFSSKFCRITLKVTDVKRKEVHTQKGRIILGRLVRGGGREPGELVHRCRSGTCMHPFIHSFMHVCKHATNIYQAPTMSLAHQQKLEMLWETFPLRSSQSTRNFQASSKSVNTTHDGVLIGPQPGRGEVEKSSRKWLVSIKVGDSQKQSERKVGEFIRNRALHAIARVLYFILKEMESHSMFHYQRDYMPKLSLKTIQIWSQFG